MSAAITDVNDGLWQFLCIQGQVRKWDGVVIATVAKKYRRLAWQLPGAVLWQGHTFVSLVSPTLPAPIRSAEEEYASNRRSTFLFATLLQTKGATTSMPH